MSSWLSSPQVWTFSAAKVSTEGRLLAPTHLVRVRQPVVVVQDHDGGDAAGGHHEHDAGEVGALKYECFDLIFRNFQLNMQQHILLEFYALIPRVGSRRIIQPV